MPVTVCTSWFAAFLAALLYPVFTNIALADKINEVGSRRNLVEQQNRSHPPARMRPAITPRGDQQSSARPLALRTKAHTRPMTNRPSGKRQQTIIPPHAKSRPGYNRSIGKLIRRHNKNGQPVGDIKLYARENRWGPAVKIQSCYGDNILSKFSLTGAENIKQKDGNKIWFQFKDTTYRNKRRGRHKWVMVKPGMLIRGRYIYLRAQSSNGNGILTLKVRGNCIE